MSFYSEADNPDLDEKEEFESSVISYGSEA